MKQYSAYKDSGIEWIGKVPKNWQLTRLKYALEEVMGGGTPDTSNMEYWSDDGIYWVAISDITASDKILKETTKKITEKALKEKGLKIIPKGTLLISIFASLGKTVILGVDATVNQAILGLIPNDKLYRDYLSYLLVDLSRTVSYYSSSNTQENLNLTKIKNLPILLPSFQEQKNIVTFLDQKTGMIEALVMKKQRLIELLKEERLAMINHAVTKGLNPNDELKDSGVKWIGKMPKHWRIKRLKYVSELIFSNVDKKTNEGEVAVQSCNYVDVYKNEFITKNIEFLNISASESEISKFSIRKGDVLVTKDSETADDIAVPAIVAEDFDNILCGYHLALIREREEALGQFIFRVFQSKDFNVHFETSAKGVTRFGLSMEDFKNAIIPLPPIEEQKSIISYINKETSQIDKSIHKIRKEIEFLQEYKESLISEVVTGKINVSEASQWQR